MIKAKPETWTVVVVGSWNPRIFTPSWVGKHLILTRPMMLDVGLASSPVLRFRSQELVMFVGEDRLIVGVDVASEDHVDRAEKVAVNAIELLSHTPLTAVGINFGFRDDEPDSFLSSLFQPPDHSKLVVAGCSIGHTVITRTVALGGEILNIVLAFVDGVVHIDFNFHKDIQSEGAKDALSGRAKKCLKLAKDLLLSAYGLNLGEKERDAET